MPRKVEIRVLYNHQQHRFFAEAETGLIIGAALENGTMSFGSDPTKIITRAYIDRDSAVSALKERIKKLYPFPMEVVFLQEEYRAAPSAPPQMPAPHRSQ